MINTCIRVYTDQNQIRRCKEEILKAESSIDRVANGLSLTGNSVRLKILFLLKKEGKMCPCDLSDILEMTVPAISQHLKKLREGRLISSEKTGQTIFYSVMADHADILDPVFSLLTSEKASV